MTLKYDGNTILQNSIEDWRYRLSHGENPKEIYQMIKRKIAQLDAMEKSENYIIIWESNHKKKINEKGIEE